MLINQYLNHLREQDKRIKKSSLKNENVKSFNQAIREEILKENFFRYLEEKQKIDNFYSGGDSGESTSKTTFSLFFELP